MSFADIFDAYSTKTAAENRAKIITDQPDIPGNVLYKLSSALEEATKGKDAVEFDTVNDSIESPPDANTESPSPTLPPPIWDEVMSSLSDLDSPEDSITSETADLKPSEDNIVSETAALNALEDLESFSSIDDNLQDDNADIEDFSEGNSAPEAFEDEDPAIESFDTQEQPNEASADDTDDDINLFGDLSQENDLENNLENDLDFNFQMENEPEFADSSPSMDDDLSIELPDELLTQNSPEPAPEEEQTLPDFSDTELNPSAESPKIQDLDPPTNIPIFKEPSTDAPNFNQWKQKDSLEDNSFSQLNLREDQIFVIREKINSLKDKTLRFEIRNAILEPQHHSAYYDELISLLLIDTPEDKISDFLNSSLEKIDTETIMPVSVPNKTRATFFANDVENFEQFKTDFTNLAKKVSIVALILITVSVALWTLVAQPLRIEGIYQRGIAAVRENKFTEGESLFNRAQQIEGMPSLKWHLNFGKVYEEKKLTRLAEQKYKAALVIAPKNIPAAKQIATFYTNLEPPDFNAALAIFSKLSTLYPKKFEVWDFYGKLHITKGQSLSNDAAAQEESFFDAARVYGDFIIKNIQNSAPYYRLIDIYIYLDSMEKINQAYYLIDQLNNKDYNIDVLSRLAGYYIDRQKLNEAERIFREVIPYVDTNIARFQKFSKKMEDLYNISSNIISNTIGSVYYEYARYNMLNSAIPNAIRLLTNAMIFTPSNTQVYNLMGEAFLISQNNLPNRISEAKKNFDKAVELDPLNYKPQVNLGHVYFYYDRELVDTADAYSKALYHYRLAQNLKPAKEKNFLLNYNSGWLEYKNGNYQDALSLWSDIYKDEPTNPVLSYAMGSVLYNMKNPRLSQIEFQKAMQSYSLIIDNIKEPSLNNPRHIEVFSQTARVRNNLGVLYANYALANPSRKTFYEKEALLNFYAAKDAADRIRQIYNNPEYNILTLTHPAIEGRMTEFDHTVPKSTTIDNKTLEFKRLILEKV